MNTLLRVVGSTSGEPLEERSPERASGTCFNRSAPVCCPGPRQSLQRAIALQFLKYRVTNELNKERWRDIVVDDFEFLLPREPYRVPSGVDGGSFARERPLDKDVTLSSIISRRAGLARGSWGLPFDLSRRRTRGRTRAETPRNVPSRKERTNERTNAGVDRVPTLRSRSA